MAKRLDKLIIIDVESTCWDGYPPDGQFNEIIEIGICIFNLKTWEIESSEDIFVKNEYSKISEFCTKLTAITQEIIDQQGIPFKEACNRLKRYKERAWASWGDYDRKQFERQCFDPHNKYEATYPFGITHINLKNLFAIKAKLTKEVGMEEALKMHRMEVQGTHHKGIDDAINIARLAAKIL